MAKMIFLSYDFDDNSFRGEIQSWLESSGLNIVVIEGKRLLHPESDQEGRNKVKRLIERCDGMLVLVGQNTHNRPWVDYEVSVAINKRLSIRWTQLPGRTGAPPSEIRANPEEVYNQKTIGAAISSM